MNKLTFAFAGQPAGITQSQSVLSRPQGLLALLTISLVFSLSACGTDSAATGTAKQAEAQTSTVMAKQSLTEWLDQQYEAELQFSPVQMTFLGRKDRNNEIDEFTYEAFAKQMNWKQQSAQQMQAQFDYSSLSDDEKLSYDLWKFQAQQMADSAEFFHSGLTFDQMNGVQSFVPTFLINFTALTLRPICKLISRALRPWDHVWKKP